MVRDAVRSVVPDSPTVSAMGTLVPGRVLGLASARYFLRHPWQLVLALSGIALGVSVVVAIDLAAGSARAAFERSTETVLGRTTHQILAGSTGMADTEFVRLRQRLPALEMTPIVEARVSVPSLANRQLILLGVDPLRESLFRPSVGPSGQEERIDLPRLLSVPNTGLIARSVGEKLGLKVGDVLALEHAGRSRKLTIVGWLAGGSRAPVLEDLIVSDVATAQELTEKVGRLDRIDLIIDRERLPGVRQKVESSLSYGQRLVDAGSRTSSALAMTRAFNLNLTMLSLLALLIGMFLIYNTASFAVVQRQRLIALLRSLGTTRGQILVLIVGEAVCLGMLGAFIGLGFGVLLASYLTDLVTRTINDLYFSVNVSTLYLSGRALFKAFILGIGAALIAAVSPALEATGVPPRVAFSRSLMESKRRDLLGVFSVCGVLLIGSALLLVDRVSTTLSGGYLALFSLVVGFALLTPVATLGLVAIFRPLLGVVLPAIGAYAAGGVSASLSRTGVAIAALMVALAGTMAMGTMIESFRWSVSEWLGTTLRADVYVYAPDSSVNAIDPKLAKAIMRLRGVESASYGRTITIHSQFGPTEVLAIQMAPGSYSGFMLLQGDKNRVWDKFDSSEAVLISESYAWHHSLGVGAYLELLTDVGEHRFEIVGVYRDYGSEHGVVAMSRRTYESYWRDRGISTIGLYLSPSASSSGIIERVHELAQPLQSLNVRSNRALRSGSLRVFDQTFAVTKVMQTLASTVAFIGVFSALMALQLERSREIGVLRALGMTRRQVWLVLGVQSLLLGVIAGVLCLPLGIAIADILTTVINQRAFGWTLDFRLQPHLMLEVFVYAVTAALLAGIYPAFKMTSRPPSVALREE